jgi:hypothetical protein
VTIGGCGAPFRPEAGWLSGATVAGYVVRVSRVRFIPPALATLRSSPPTGELWQFEVKFDGFRIQIHKLGLAVALFGNYAERTIMRSAWREVYLPPRLSHRFTPHNSACVQPLGKIMRMHVPQPTHRSSFILTIRCFPLVAMETVRGGDELCGVGKWSQRTKLLKNGRGSSRVAAHSA